MLHKLVSFRPWLRGREAATQFGLLERAYLNHQTLLTTYIFGTMYIKKERCERDIKLLASLPSSVLTNTVASNSECRFCLY
jgi:hypothetical protein